MIGYKRIQLIVERALRLSANTGDKIITYGDGNLYSYQHGMAINMLNIAIGDVTKWINLQASRQSGN